MLQLVASRQVGTPESRLLHMLGWDEGASVLQGPQGTPRPGAGLGSVGRAAEGQRSAYLLQVVGLPGLALKPRNVAELQGRGQC